MITSSPQETHRIYRTPVIRTVSLACAAAATIFCAAEAAEVKLAWDPAPGATGYYVDYGVDPGDLSIRRDAGPSTQVTIGGLSDCEDWFFAVRAYDATSVGPASATISGWARPDVISTNVVRQGSVDQILGIDGQNFRPGATVTIDNPGVHVGNTTYVDCNRILVTATIGPAASGERPAQVGYSDLRVTNPNGIHDISVDEMFVNVDLARLDLDRTVTSTEDRVNGPDLDVLTAHWGGCDHPALPSCDAGDAALYFPDADFNGDGWIDGLDLEFLVMHRWGRCWSLQDYEWTLDPVVDANSGVRCPSVSQ